MRANGCIHDGWLLLSNVSKHFNEDFLYNLLNSDYVQKQFDSLAAGSGVRNLNIDVVKKVKIRIPSIATQTSVIQILNSYDNYLLEVSAMLKSSQILKLTLLTDLLSGDNEIPASYDTVIDAS